MMKTKNFRRRVDDDGDGDDATQVKPPSLHSASKISGKKEKGAAKKPSGPKLLSFAEDEDGSDVISKPVSVKKEKPSLVSFDTDDDSFKPKKKASGFGASQASGPKLSISKDKPAVLHSNFQPQAGEYTKEKLLELQKNTIRLGGAKPPVQENKPLEPVIVLKGQMKPAVSATVEIQTIVTDREVLGASDGKLVASRAKDASYRVKLDTDDAENRLGLMGIGAGAEGGGVTHIPDAAAIAAAKAKRERLRQAQALPDYIPVGNSDTLDLRGKPRDAATSEREEDSSSGDEGEMQTRIAMMGELPNEKVKAGVFESMEDKIEDRTLAGLREDDEEDEERRWEEEQLRKGFGKRVDDAATWPGATQSVPRQEVLHTESYFSGGLATAPLPSSAWGFGGHNMESMTISQRAEAVLSTLYETLRRTRVPSWNHQVMSIVPQAARIAAYRFGTSVRLLKNVAYWKDVLATPLLERLALEDLLCGKILPHLRNLVLSPYDAISRSERVVSALSGVWIGPNVATRPKLQPLVDFLASIGRAIEKRKGVSSDDVLGLVRRLIRMLVELNEYDRARSLSKTFQLKEAL